MTAVLRELGVSLELMLQRGRSPGEAVPVVLVTHETQESAMVAALERIAAAGRRAGDADVDPHRSGVDVAGYVCRVGLVAAGAAAAGATR